MIQLVEPPNPSDHAQYITISRGMSGHYAVIVEWNPDGFWEPRDTGVGRYDSPAAAVEEARMIAEDEDVPLYVKGLKVL